MELVSYREGLAAFVGRSGKQANNELLRASDSDGQIGTI
jgi:hypothetical protein